MLTPITAVYTALWGLLLVILSLLVAYQRNKRRIGIGDGGDIAMSRMIRVHGNATEYVPTALILILALELNDAGGSLIHALGSALIVGRIFHAFGLAKTEGRSAGRVVGTALTLTVIVAAAIINIIWMLSY